VAGCGVCLAGKTTREEEEEIGSGWLERERVSNLSEAIMRFI
jgi:hypothetical protein